MLDLTLQAPQKIKRIAEGFHVKPMADALSVHPELWDVHTARTEHPDSPHYGCSDIWARFGGEGTSGAAPHFAVWYPGADAALPVRDMAREVMYLTGATILGGVLITRIPPRRKVRPHVDGGWHANFFRKVAVQIEAAPEQTYSFEDDSLVTKPGDLFTFTNQSKHWVTNDSDVDRITAIFCVSLQ